MGKPDANLQTVTIIIKLITDSTGKGSYSKAFNDTVN